MIEFTFSMNGNKSYQRVTFLENIEKIEEYVYSEVEVTDYVIRTEDEVIIDIIEYIEYFNTKCESGAVVLRKKRKTSEKKKGKKEKPQNDNEVSIDNSSAKYNDLKHRNVKRSDENNMGLRFSKKQNADQHGGEKKNDNNSTVGKDTTPTKPEISENQVVDKENDHNFANKTEITNIQKIDDVIDSEHINYNNYEDAIKATNQSVTITFQIEDFSDIKSNSSNQTPPFPDQSHEEPENFEKIQSQSSSSEMDEYSRNLSEDVINKAVSQANQLLKKNSAEKENKTIHDDSSLFALDKHVDNFVSETIDNSYNDIKYYIKDKRACNGYSNYRQKDSLIEVANKNINSKNGLRNHNRVTVENVLCKENIVESISDDEQRNLIRNKDTIILDNNRNNIVEKQEKELHKYAKNLADELIEESSMSLKNLSLRRLSLKAKPKLSKSENIVTDNNKNEEKDNSKHTNNKEHKKFFKKKKVIEKQKNVVTNGTTENISNNSASKDNEEKSVCPNKEENEIRQTETDGVKQQTQNNLSPNNNNLNIKNRPISDRPLSGFAEKLAELLADEEEDLAFFDSEEELNNSLLKMRENFSAKRAISVEIDKMQRRYSVDELNDYGTKKLKSHINKKKANRKKNYRSRGERPKSLYDQDILNDFLSNMNGQTGNDDEGDQSSVSEAEDDEDEPQTVHAAIQLFENEIPLLPDDRFRANTTSEYDRVFDETLKMQRSVSVTSSSSRKGSGFLKKAAVIDAGCGALKAGLCGENQPRCYCPSVIGTPRRFSQDVSKMKKGFYVGDEAWSYAGMLQIEHPIRQNISNWSDVTHILEYIMEEELNINNSEHPVLLTEMSLTSKRNREKITEIMFESFGIPSFYLANQGALALYSMGLTTGLCLNSGYYTTQAIPVYEGNVLPYATTQLDIGGDHVTDYLGRMLQGNSGFSFSSSSERLVLNSMKQAVCYVPLDAKREEENFKEKSDMNASYSLPDGQIIEVGSERCIASEILFDPDMLGLQQPNTAELISESLAKINTDLRDYMSSNILVSGGNTKLKGFSERLENELSSIYSNSSKNNVKLQYADNRILSTWVGGSVLASIPVFRDQWINIESYAETGSHIIHKYCF